MARAVKDVESELESAGLGLPKRTTTPLSQGYWPELDQTAELYAQQLNYYQGLVGVLRWICKLGWVDILMPPQYLVSVREDKLQYLLHVAALYTMKQFNQLTMGVWWHGVKLWPTAFCHAAALVKVIPRCTGSDTGGYAWTGRKPVMMTCFVDANHAWCPLTQRSQTGVILYINHAPIIW